MFSYTGVPVVLRTDGGPQFTAGLTRRFLSKWDVQHQISSPHYPQANGHAESAVKAVKRLVKKTTTNGQLDCDAFAEGLLELRNSPRADGRSAAQVLYGHPLRSGVPAHHRAFAKRWQKLADECDARAAEEKRKTAERYNSAAKPLNSIQLGQHVLVQDTRTGLWDRTGVISGIGKFRNFLVKLPSGRLCWRNRRFLRPVRPFVTEKQGQPQPQQQMQQQPRQHVNQQPQQQPRQQVNQQPQQQVNQQPQQRVNQEPQQQSQQQSQQQVQQQAQQQAQQQPQQQAQQQVQQQHHVSSGRQPPQERQSPPQQLPGQQSPQRLEEQPYQSANQQVHRPQDQPQRQQMDDELHLEQSAVAADIADAPEGTGRAPLRRSTRVSSRPEHLQVHWGAKSYL